MTTYYEDIAVGEPETLGQVRADRDEMVAFAQRYDPQPIHTDPDAAAGSHFGGLVASGWYTASLCMRVLVEEVLDDSAALGALGLDELQWPAPVRPGDVLEISNEVIEKRPSESQPSTGVVRAELVATRTDDTVVCRWTASVLWERRQED